MSLPRRISLALAQRPEIATRQIAFRQICAGFDRHPHFRLYERCSRQRASRPLGAGEGHERSRRRGKTPLPHMLTWHKERADPCVPRPDRPVGAHLRGAIFAIGPPMRLPTPIPPPGAALSHRPSPSVSLHRRLSFLGTAPAVAGLCWRSAPDTPPHPIPAPRRGLAVAKKAAPAGDLNLHHSNHRQVSMIRSWTG